MPVQPSTTAHLDHDFHETHPDKTEGEPECHGTGLDRDRHLQSDALPPQGRNARAHAACLNRIGPSVLQQREVSDRPYATRPVPHPAPDRGMADRGAGAHVQPDVLLGWLRNSRFGLGPEPAGLTRLCPDHHRVGKLAGSSGPERHAGLDTQLRPLRPLRQLRQLRPRVDVVRSV